MTHEVHLAGLDSSERYNLISRSFKIIDGYDQTDRTSHMQVQALRILGVRAGTNSYSTFRVAPVRITENGNEDRYALVAGFYEDNLGDPTLVVIDPEELTRYRMRALSAIGNDSESQVSISTAMDSLLQVMWEDSGLTIPREGIDEVQNLRNEDGYFPLEKLRPFWRDKLFDEATRLVLSDHEGRYFISDLEDIINGQLGHTFVDCSLRILPVRIQGSPDSNDWSLGLVVEFIENGTPTMICLDPDTLYRNVFGENIQILSDPTRMSLKLIAEGNMTWIYPKNTDIKE